MAKIKICGLTRKEDICYVNEADPDYIGFVFAKSRRQVDFDTAKSLKRGLNQNIKAVGVFVNEETELIERLCREDIIDIIQLHGDEDEKYIETLRCLTEKKIIKALRIGKPGDVRETNADYALFDTYHSGSYGGTGEAFDWRLLNGCDKPFFLAGGLNINNISEAIKALSPFCVDLSSGVETDGKKDRGKIINIVNLVKRSVNLNE